MTRTPEILQHAGDIIRMEPDCACGNSQQGRVVIDLKLVAPLLAIGFRLDAKACHWLTNLRLQRCRDGCGRTAANSRQIGGEWRYRCLRQGQGGETVDRGWRENVRIAVG